MNCYYVLRQILELDSAWRQRMQKEQVSHLAHSATTSQQRQHSQEQQLLHKERTAAKQVWCLATYACKPHVQQHPTTP